MHLQVDHRRCLRPFSSVRNCIPPRQPLQLSILKLHYGPYLPYHDPQRYDKIPIAEAAPCSSLDITQTSSRSPPSATTPSSSSSSSSRPSAPSSSPSTASRSRPPGSAEYQRLLDSPRKPMPRRHPQGLEDVAAGRTRPAQEVFDELAKNTAFRVELTPTPCLTSKPSMEHPKPANSRVKPRPPYCPNHSVTGT